MLFEAAATIFSRKQRSAATLDEPQLGIEFVRPVDGEVERGKLIQGGERHAVLLGQGARGFRRRDADHVETVTDPIGQQQHECPGGRAGAEAKLHAAFDELQRTGRGSGFEFVLAQP